MVVEFIGLPGSGKTYFGYKLVNELNSKGNPACSILEKSRTNFFYKALFKIFRLYYKRTKNYKLILKKCLLLLKDYELIKANFSKSSLNEYVEEIVFIYMLYCKYERRQKIYLFDEGIIHKLNIISVNFGIDNKIVKSLIDELVNYKIPVVYLYCDKDLAIKSIHDRNRHICFFDDLDEGQLNDFICLFDNGIHNIVNYIDVCQINRKDNLNSNLLKVQIFLEI